MKKPKMSKRAPEGEYMTRRAWYTLWQKFGGIPEKDDVPPEGIAASWMDVEVFFHDMGEKPPGKILCRRDPEKPFNRLNCYWGDRRSMALNRRRPKKTHTGMSEKKAVRAHRMILLGYEVAEVAEDLGVDRHIVYDLRAGRTWPGTKEIAQKQLKGVL